MSGLLGLLRSLVVYYAIPWRWSRMRRFYRHFINSGDLSFDIGSHVGNRIHTWLSLGARVVAVEPQPSCAALLRAFYARNQRVTLVQAAVSDSGGHRVLHVSRRHPTLATVSARWVQRAADTPGFSHVEWDSTVRVPSLTLDQLIERHGQPAFIKVDVEGHEDRVVASLSRPVRALSFEYLPADLTVALACIDHLESLAEYRYNLSAAESMRLQFNNWLDAQTLRRHLSSLGAGTLSGDVYARIHSSSGLSVQNATNSSKVRRSSG
ncbi:MAG: FkbM family methyltransferase [Spirochaetaceae bacterium]|nr:MAG: FkbM family methyltransferase [Spirochaetaceae bacterium]